MSKISLKSQNLRKLTPQICQFGLQKTFGGPKGPSQVAKGHQPSAGARRSSSLTLNPELQNVTDGMDGIHVKKI